LGAQLDAIIAATLAEIAENLERRELDAIERAELMARRVEMVEARKQVEEAAHDISRQAAAKSKTLTNPKGAGRKAGGVKQTARDLKIPERSLRRSLAIAGLAPETKAKAADLGLASNKAALLEAAKAAEPAAQIAALEARAKPVAQLPHDLAMCRLRAEWAAAPSSARTEFLVQISGDPR